MWRALFAGLLTVSMAASIPADAAQTKKPTKKAATKKSASKAAPAKKQAQKPQPVKKTATKAGADDELKPTVKFHDKVKPTPKPAVTVKAPEREKTAEEKSKDKELEKELVGKTPEELEKLAKEKAKKDPKAALTVYEKLVTDNPNYGYAGDTYVEMYNIASKSGADILTQFKYAGFAAQKLEAGLSRSPVSQKQIQQFKRLEEQLVNKWIESEIKNIMNSPQ